jgi:tRNA G10  N-methylase Trm11
VGHTLAIQEFEAYGERDFDRPGRSARRGMLPPKLAQMMVNISRGDRRLPLLDPFCGSGTVLGEALLMGYEQVIGSDLSAEAVADTKAYLEWLEKKHPEFRGRWRVFASDARRLNEALKTGSVGAIVTEPLLGPPQSGHETRMELERLMAGKLAPLYREAIASLSGLLSPGGAAVFAFPVFGRERGAITVPIHEVRGPLELVPLIPKGDSPLSGLIRGLSPSGGARYERPDQKVGREIILLKKI